MKKTTVNAERVMWQKNHRPMTGPSINDRREKNNRRVKQNIRSGKFDY